MKKVILILSIILMGINVNAQYVNKHITIAETHYFLPAYANGIVSSTITMGVVDIFTDNRYIIFASGFVASVAAGWIKNKIHVHNGDEYSDNEMWNAGLGGLSSIVVFHIVMNKPKKSKKLIDL